MEEQPIFIKKLKLRAEHVDFRRKLRLPVLMTLFQECCIAHTEELGMGRSMTLDRGFLWVVTSERIEIERMPEYDEEITLECYPGPMLHFFFPRHLVVKDAEGKILARGCAMWALIDERDRSMIDPKEHHVCIAGHERGDEVVPAMMIPLPILSHSVLLKANYSQVDINGHLNNASYASLALDLLEGEELRRDVKELTLTFQKEIVLGEEFEVRYEKEKEACWYASENRFRLKLTLC